MKIYDMKIVAVVMVCLCAPAVSFAEAGVPSGGGLGAVRAEKKGWGTGVGHGKRDRKNAQDMFSEKLGLSDQQKEQLKALRIAEKEKISPLREALRAKRLALRTELEKATIDTAAVENIKSEIKSIQNQLFDLQVEGMTKTKEIFTPEQREKMKQLRQEHERFRQGSRNSAQDGTIRRKGARGAGGWMAGAGGVASNTDDMPPPPPMEDAMGEPEGGM